MLFDDKTKGIAQKYLSMLSEKTEITESHFKVGDKVKCIASGMTGTVTKLDTPEDGKYYTVKTDSGKVMKYAPDELEAITEAACGSKKYKEAVEIIVPKKSKENTDGEKQDDDSDDEDVVISKKDNKMKVKVKKDDDKENMGEAKSVKDIAAAAEKRKQYEEAEQVDEISKKTVGSYIQKASGSQFAAGHRAGEKRDTGTTQKAIDKASKRQQGVARAVTRLTREEVEVIEAKKEDLPFTPDAPKKSPIAKAGKYGLEKSTVKHLAKQGMKDKRTLNKENYQWDWDAIADAPEEEIDAMIEQMNDEDFDSFVSELDSISEGNNWYQASTGSVQPEDENGREKLEPRAEADKAFANAHRQMIKIKDYPGKDKPITNAKPQAPIRPGEKRNPEPRKTLSDIRNK
jgi:hypothetical protein